MTDYRAYREHVEISNNDMTATVKEVFPAYTKITAAMVNAPDKYGVGLMEEAEQHLVDTYGIGPGLQFFGYEPDEEDTPALRSAMLTKSAAVLTAAVEEEPEEAVEEKHAAKTENRTKPNRITFSMTDEVYSEAQAAKEKAGFPSMQEFLYSLLLDYLEGKYEKGKHEAG